MRCYPMTPEQIDLVRKSFDALWPFRRKLAEQFYGRFFELAPDTRRLFPNDMEKQQLKLMDTLAAIVGTLDQREICQSIISHTGRKHAEFGVQTSHFVAFGDALIWGLRQQFGPAFTPEMQQAWIVLYNAIQAENDACRKNTVTNRPTSKASDMKRRPFDPALASMVARRHGGIRSGWARRPATSAKSCGIVFAHEPPRVSIATRERRHAGPASGIEWISNSRCS